MDINVRECSSQYYQKDGTCMVNSRLMDLVMVSNFGLADGGRETWAYNFIPRLLAADQTLHIRLFGLRLQGRPSFEDNLLAAVREADRPRLRIRIFRTPRTRLPLFITMLRQLRKNMRRANVRSPEYVLAVGSVMELLLLLANRKHRHTRKIVWLRTVWIDEKSYRIPRFLMRLARLVEAQLLHRADMLIANGDDTAAYYRSRGLTVVVIRNAVDLTKWSLDAVEPTLPLKIGFIGRLAAPKGMEQFLAAISHINSEKPMNDFEFHIIGDGPLRGKVQKAAEAGQAVFHGSIANTDLLSSLKGLEVCVALSFKSAAGGVGGLSNALLEQMAAGRVIVAWDNEIYRQILDTDSAYLVPQGDSIALVAAFREIADDLQAATQKARRAQSLVQQCSFENHMLAFQEVVSEAGHVSRDP